jgi:hypothetical protein
MIGDYYIEAADSEEVERSITVFRNLYKVPEFLEQRAADEKAVAIVID